MKKTIILSLFVLCSLMAFAQAPSKATILNKVGDSWEGTLNGKKGNWYAKITLLENEKFDVSWAEGKTSTHKAQGGMGHGGGRAENPVAANLRDFNDGSQVRIQWNSLNELQVEWWPSRQAQSGQRANKPAHMKGTLKHKPAPVLLSCTGSKSGAKISFVSKSGKDIKLKVDWDEGATFASGNLKINNGTCTDCSPVGGIGRPHGKSKMYTIRQTNSGQPVSIAWGGNQGNIRFCAGDSNAFVTIPNR